MSRPLLLFPALGIGFAVAAGFFMIYGRLTRPDVPLQVSATVDHFAPGVAIGSTLRDSRKKLFEAHWVQHLGYVGEVNSPQFALVRLAPAAAARQKRNVDESALVESVEMVSARGDA